MDVILVGMLAASLGRHVDDASFEEFEHALLHALTADVARDGGVVALAGYLVYLVDEDNAALGGFDVEIGHLEQAREDAFDVFAHITRFGEDSGIHDGEGHLQ